MNERISEADGTPRGTQMRWTIPLICFSTVDELKSTRIRFYHSLPSTFVVVIVASFPVSTPKTFLANKSLSGAQYAIEIGVQEKKEPSLILRIAWYLFFSSPRALLLKLGTMGYVVLRRFCS